MNEPDILKELDELFEKYSKNRKSGESFGDFAIREKLVTI